MAEMNRREFVAAAAAACACVLCPSGLLHAAEAAGPVDVGELKQFASDGVTSTWVASHRFFVVRQNGRLYALSATCTHRSNASVAAGESQFRCPRHGSVFALSGAVTKGPARVALPRYAIRLDERKHVIVDTAKSFEEGKWNDPGCYIEIAQ